MSATPSHSHSSETRETEAPKKNMVATSHQLGSGVETSFTLSFPSPSMEERDAGIVREREMIFSPGDDTFAREENDAHEESDEERRRREEEESIALARALMAEEAMAASYHMSMDYLQNHRDQFSEEDLAALQAAMEEDDVEEEQPEVDQSNMSYETMLRLGECLGDVKAERWSRIAQQKIDDLPTLQFKKGEPAGNEDNDCAHRCLVCQFDYEEGDSLRLLPCNHCFHKDCVDQWLLSKDCCAYCRVPIVPDNDA
eukprot:Nitzschia sp. Nitz4//scaffold58_size112336//39906//40673//NITZ4_004027-RA/size112336-processed-gene-0.85-mRNA-1//-1//CDS//3329554971//7678//frame0